MLQEIKENEIIATCASEVFKLAEQPKPNDEFISSNWEMPQNLNIAFAIRGKELCDCLGLKLPSGIAHDLKKYYKKS